MSDLNLSAKSYLDFAGLGELRSRAKINDQSAAQEVGRQFEAMFVEMVFKSVREANEHFKSDLMGSSSVDSFEQMYHQELSQVMAQRGTFGLGDWLSEQVHKQANTTKAVDAYEQLSTQKGSSAMAIDSAAQARAFPLQEKSAKGIKL